MLLRVSCMGLQVQSHSLAWALSNKVILKLLILVLTTLLIVEMLGKHFMLYEASFAPTGKAST